MLTKVDIDWLKAEFLPSLVEAVKSALSEKLDRIDTNLDKTVGELDTMRKTQELHQNDHNRLNERLEKVEKKLRIASPQN